MWNTYISSLTLNQPSRAMLYDDAAQLLTSADLKSPSFRLFVYFVVYLFGLFLYVCLHVFLFLFFFCCCCCFVLRACVCVNLPKEEGEKKNTREETSRRRAPEKVIYQSPKFQVTTETQTYRLDCLVVKASAPRAEGPGFEFRLRRAFSGSSHTRDSKIGTPLAIVPGAWRYRVSAGTGRPGVRILWLGEVESWICGFYLSVAARQIVIADPSLRYTSLLLGR